MRPIDADALEKQIQDVYCKGCDNYGGVRCRACWTDDAIAQVDYAPTIDAIPIEWLRAKQHELKNYIDYRPDAVVDYLIWLWDREKEAT